MSKTSTVNCKYTVTNKNVSTHSKLPTCFASPQTSPGKKVFQMENYSCLIPCCVCLYYWKQIHKLLLKFRKASHNIYPVRHDTCSRTHNKITKNTVSKGILYKSRQISNSLSVETYQHQFSNAETIYLRMVTVRQKHVGSSVWIRTVVLVTLRVQLMAAVFNILANNGIILRRKGKGLNHREVT